MKWVACSDEHTEYYHPTLPFSFSSSESFSIFKLFVLVFPGWNCSGSLSSQDCFKETLFTAYGEWKNMHMTQYIMDLLLCVALEKNKNNIIDP